MREDRDRNFRGFINFSSGKCRGANFYGKRNYVRYIAERQRKSATGFSSQRRDELDRYGRKIGLALGSGGAKGAAHIGAIKAFEEEGFSFDVVAGTSIGSVVVALYAKSLR